MTVLRAVAGLAFVSLLVPFGWQRSEAAEAHQYDVVVYGATSGGVTAAVQAARMGKDVVLVNHYRHVGGLTSSGLGQTDRGRAHTIGGLSRQFYQRVREVYRDEDRWQQETRQQYMDRTWHLQPDDDAQWGFEPRVAEQIFREMLDEAGVNLVPDEFLVRDDGAGVKLEGRRIRALVTESGNEYYGKMFIDATYEGDLLAEAGVSYIVGREANAKYDETLNGIQTQRTHNHVFTYDGVRNPERPLPERARVDPYVEPGNPDSGLLPGINPDAGGEDGEADDRVQSYCYRLCLTDDPDNSVPLEKPDGYDEADFELLFRMFEAGEERIPWLPGAMPNRKNDTNNRWAVSMNLVGGSDEYPEAGYEERERIEAEHKYWQAGIMYSLAHHERVPEHVRAEVSQWGYAADEFVDNDHWPYQIYVRVGRRMIGDYVITEHDCRLARRAEDPVGIGSYTMDSHNVQRYVTPEGYVQNEGNIEVPPAGPYGISYRAIVPKQEEVENLLVPVAVSSSHIAFGSMRMEPVFMILGQSAGTAAVHAIEENTAVQAIDYARLRERIVEDGQVLPGPPVLPEDLSGIVVDHSDAELKGAWEHSDVVQGFLGHSYLHDNNTGKGKKSVRFEVKVPETGEYDVQVSYTPHGNRATNVPVTVHDVEGERTVVVDQTVPPTIEERFTSIGTYRFSSQTPATFVISNRETSGYVIVDAVRLVPVER